MSGVQFPSFTPDFRGVSEALRYPDLLCAPGQSAAATLVRCESREKRSFDGDSSLQTTSKHTGQRSRARKPTHGYRPREVLVLVRLRVGEVHRLDAQLQAFLQGGLRRLEFTALKRYLAHVVGHQRRRPAKSC